MGCTASTEALSIPNSPRDVFKSVMQSENLAEELEQMVSSNLDVNMNISHDTIGSCQPIHVAAYAGNLKALKILIEAGADISLKDNKGQTALFWAIDRSHIDVVEELVQAGSDVNLESSEGWTPLVMAIERSTPTVVEILLEKGADPSKRQEISLAVKENKPDIVLLLLKAKASPKGVMVKMGNEEVDLWTWAEKMDETDILSELGKKPPRVSCEGVENNSKERITSGKSKERKSSSKGKERKSSAKENERLPSGKKSETKASENEKGEQGTETKGNPLEGLINPTTENGLSLQKETTMETLTSSEIKTEKSTSPEFNKSPALPPIEPKFTASAPEVPNNAIESLDTLNSTKEPINKQITNIGEITKESAPEMIKEAKSETLETIREKTAKPREPMRESTAKTREPIREGTAKAREPLRQPTAKAKDSIPETTELPLDYIHETKIANSNQLNHDPSEKPHATKDDKNSSIINTDKESNNRSNTGTISENEPNKNVGTEVKASTESKQPLAGMNEKMEHVNKNGDMEQKQNNNNGPSEGTVNDNSIGNKG